MYIVPTPEAAEEMNRMLVGPLVMLGLYRLRDVADYSASPGLSPETPVSGRELFDRYIAGSEPLLAKNGANRGFLADAGSYFIGPPDERWDVMQIVRFPSLEAFWACMSCDEVQADHPHRVAILEDSRLMPMTERSLD